MINTKGIKRRVLGIASKDSSMLISGGILCSVRASKIFSVPGSRPSVCYERKTVRFSIHLLPKIWCSSNAHWQNSVEPTARCVLGANLSLADVPFSSQPEIYKLHETQRGAGSTTCPVYHLSVCRADWKSWVAI